jgi:hypothetical protein
MNCLNTHATVAFAQDQGAMLLQTLICFDSLTVQILDSAIDRLLSNRAEILEKIQQELFA